MSLRLRRIANGSKHIVKDAFVLYRELLKVMVPVMILVKLALEFGVVTWFGNFLAPVMQLVGLPGEMSIVWVMAMLVNIYAAAVTMIALLPTVPLTAAEASVLGTMILIAHALPIEQKIISRAGPGFWITTLLRIVGAILTGWLLWKLYALTGTLQEPVKILFFPAAVTDSSWQAWATDSLWSLASIFGILVILLGVLKLFDITGLTNLLSRALAPLLRLLGIGREATSITLSGMLLGITYGGALILQDVRQGNISRRDVFLASSFLCLSHSIIEDTLFMLALGTHFSASLVIRPIVSILIVMLIARLIRHIPDEQFDRWFCGPAK